MNSCQGMLRWRGVAFWTAIAGTLAAPACSSSESPPPAAVPCALNSDCDAPLICAVGLCRAQCKQVTDCEKGGSCIDDGQGHGVCQLPAENNRPCDLEVNCDPPLACASDYRCRNLCNQSSDCNVAGITGRVCATDANGAHYCADPQVPGEVSSTNIIIEIPPPLANGMIPSTPAPPVGEAGGAPAGDATTPMSGSEGGAGAEASTGADAGDANPASDGAACTSITACGGQGQPCRAGGCNANLSCDSQSGTCECGKPGLSCCNGQGGSCLNNVTCDSTGMCACGKAGEVCCPSGAGDGGPTCTSPNLCAGSACGCLSACSGALTVQRTDGTLWHYLQGSGTPTQIMLPTESGGLVASSFSDGGQLVCAVQSSDGSVWCWNTNNGNNGDGQLGNNTTMTSTTPVPVAQNSGGQALTGAKLVAVADTVDAACAVNATGVWCWGNGVNGVVGNGGPANSPFAVAVQTDASSGTLFGANDVVDALSVSSDHACARKTDGTAWCWGDNSSGQIGAGTTQAKHSYPVQVSNLSNQVVDIAVGGTSTCAATTDGSVYCWGSNASQVLGPGSTLASSNVPVKVTSGADAGGAPFAGAVRVLFEDQLSGYACAAKSNGELWCWGNGQTGIEQQRTSKNLNAEVHALGEVAGPEMCWIGFDGLAYFGGTVAPTQVACP